MAQTGPMARFVEDLMRVRTGQFRKDSEVNTAFLQ